MGTRVPPLNIPETAAAWESQRASIRTTLSNLLGSLPAPIIPIVEQTGSERGPGFSVERFRFHNGDHLSGPGAIVTGVLLIPDGLKSPAPAIQFYHYHGGKFHLGKNELWEVDSRGVMKAVELTSRGWVVMAIDAYGFGERMGTGPSDETDPIPEDSIAKRDLWYGRTLWGMRLRDEAIALSYLVERPEVDPERVGAIGMSMGATRVWWRMALDERIKVGVAVACLTRYQDLIESKALWAHALYYYVPGMLECFDAEAVVALAAPRPLLCLTGEEDIGSPPSGVETIGQVVRRVYRLLGKPDCFRSLLLPDVGHEWTPDMWEETIEWLERWL